MGNEIMIDNDAGTHSDRMKATIHSKIALCRLRTLGDDEWVNPMDTVAGGRDVDNAVKGWCLGSS